VRAPARELFRGQRAVSPRRRLRSRGARRALRPALDGRRSGRISTPGRGPAALHRRQQRHLRPSLPGGHGAEGAAFVPALVGGSSFFPIFWLLFKIGMLQLCLIVLVAVAHQTLSGEPLSASLETVIYAGRPFFDLVVAGSGALQLTSLHPVAHAARMATGHTPGLRLLSRLSVRVAPPPAARRGAHCSRERAALCSGTRGEKAPPGYPEGLVNPRERLLEPGRLLPGRRGSSWRASRPAPARLSRARFPRRPVPVVVRHRVESALVGHLQMKRGPDRGPFSRCLRIGS